MWNKFRYVLLVSGLILVANFIVFRMYGDALRSTHLFIVRSMVFYPFAWLNLVVGIILISVLVWEWITDRRTENC